MNYRHGYHAGNFADVLKHTALCELLRLLTAKDKKLFVLDTHAGAGGYDLAGSLARRTGEAEAGIVRLAGLPRAGMPAAVARYLAAVAAYDRKFGPAGGQLRRYPGSPRLVRAALRPGDRFVACELHPEEALAAEARVRRRPRRRGAAGRRLPGAEGAAAAGRTARAGADRSAVRGDRRVRAPVARPAPGRAALRDRLLRDLVSDQGRSGGARSSPISPRSSRWSLELRLDGIAPGKLAACGLAVINPPWRFEEAMREALPWIAAGSGRASAGPSMPRQPSRGSGIIRVMTNDTKQSAAPARMAPV